MLQPATVRLAHLLLATSFISTSFATNPVAAQSLDGTWDIAMIISDGRVLDPAEARRVYSADGQITVSGQKASVVLPSTLQRRDVPLRFNPATSPATIEIAFANGAGGHGVAMVSGNTAIICIASQDQLPAKAFSSVAGSGNLLISLTRTGTGVPASTVSVGAPPTVQTTQPIQQQMTLSDQQIRTLLVGTWGHQDKDTQRLLTLNSDGTMSAVVTWKDQFKKIFHSDVRSSGNWKVENGVVVAQMTASTDNNVRGQIYSYRIRSINDKELTAIDQDGKLRQEWKAPTP